MLKLLSAEKVTSATCLLPSLTVTVFVPISSGVIVTVCALSNPYSNSAATSLYAVSASLPEEAHSDPVHYYTPMGTETYTNAVLSHIVPLLGITEEITYKEALYTDKPIGI